MESAARRADFGVMVEQNIGEQQRGWRTSRVRIVSIASAVCISVGLICWMGISNSSQGSTHPSELTIRSAKMMIRDLAQSWDTQHYDYLPYEFCGDKHLTYRQTKLCAEHFLSLLDDTEDNSPADTNGTAPDPHARLFGIPKLEAYSECMAAPQFYQVKGCIKAITDKLGQPDLVHLEHAGTTWKDKQLARIGMKAVTKAQPDNSIGGLNGGMDGKIGEMSTEKYLQKVDADTGVAHGLRPHCEELGIKGCEDQGYRSILQKHNGKWILGQRADIEHLLFHYKDGFVPNHNPDALDAK